MTNYEKIIRMSPEEMASITMCPNETDSTSCIPCHRTDEADCHTCCLHWLNQEYAGGLDHCSTKTEGGLAAAKARLMGAVVDFMNDMDRLIASAGQCES
jgi:hypothetical protein